jgi:Uma2 family endonuclease
MSVLHAPTYEWTVEEYEKLNDAGIFTEGDRVELLNGQIIVISPIGYRHATAVTLLNKFFVRRSRDRYEVTPGNPFILDERSAPQPDLCLVDPAVNTQGHHPSPEQVFLAIEVSDSTLRYDREDKRPAYARGGVREYWIVNLTDNVLEVYRDPAGEIYRDAHTLGAEAKVAPLAFPDVELRVGDFLP